MQPYERARRLLELEWTPVPVITGTKKTKVKNWSRLLLSYDNDTLNYFKQRHMSNIALVLGNVVEADIEFPSHQHLSTLMNKYPWLKCAPILTTPRGSSIFVQCPELAYKYRKIPRPDDPRKALIEIRSGSRYRLIYGTVDGAEYKFIQHDLLEEGIRPSMLPVVTAEGLFDMLKDLTAMAGYGIGETWAPQRQQPPVASASSSRRQYSETELWFHDLLRDSNLFLKVFNKYSEHRLGESGKAILCPFHKEYHPSSSWYTRNDGVTIFCDFHARGEDAERTYDILDCYAAFKTKSNLRRLTSPQERLLWAARLGEEFDCLPASARSITAKFDLYLIAIRDLPLPQSDLKIMEAVLTALRERSLAQALLGVDIFGDSVRYLQDRLGIDKALINRAINLACLLGIFEKTSLPSSKNCRRPDRLRLRGTTVRAILDSFRKLAKVGATSLRKLNQNVAYLAFGANRAAAVFRRQSDPWEEKGCYPRWLSRRSEEAGPPSKPGGRKPGFLERMTSRLQKQLDAIIGILESGALDPDIQLSG